MHGTGLTEGNNFDFSELSVTERIDLAQRLWESVREAVESAPLSADEAVEIENRIRDIDQGVNAYADRPEIEHGGQKAYYVPASDSVHIPEPSRFVNTQEYYSTLFHELAHSTGHSKRLDRGIDKNASVFGSPEYAREELVAEMAAAFLCGHAGITPATVENAAAYIGGWIKVLKGDKRLAVSAAGAAQRAADWIRGARGQEGEGGVGAPVTPPGDPGPEVGPEARAVESMAMAA